MCYGLTCYLSLLFADFVVFADAFVVILAAFAVFVRLCCLLCLFSQISTLCVFLFFVSKPEWGRLIKGALCIVKV